jgi:large conductance mechanosensitive channel
MQIVHDTRLGKGIGNRAESLFDEEERRPDALELAVVGLRGSARPPSEVQSPAPTAVTRGGSRPRRLEQGGETVLTEFKDFLFRGNIVELAIAFVMGVAFAAVVNSLVRNLVMPVIAMIIGKPDFSDLTFAINDAVYRYGAFLTDVIQFVAIAAAVFFFIVKPVQRMLARVRREPIEEGTPDEERRHQELLAALNQLGTR